MGFDIDDLRRRGFGGFVALARLGRLEPQELPVASGVYVVVREREDEPKFLERSGGGWWKRQDPTVPVERLQREWVAGTPTLYIGKAMSLRERIGELLRFSDGDAKARHWAVGCSGRSRRLASSCSPGERSLTMAASRQICSMSSSPSSGGCRSPT
jgi:hypothetical protein